MKSKDRVYVRMNKDNYKKLTKRVNYLSATRTSVILLSLFLYQDNILSEEEISENLKEVKSETDVENFYIEFPDYFVTLFKVKERFLYSFDEFISAFLNALLKDESIYWGEADEKLEKSLRLWKLDSDLLNWLTAFSKKTRISQTLLLNYSFMHKVPNNIVNSDESKKERKGLLLTSASTEFIDSFPVSRKPIVVENHIKALKKLVQ